MRWPNRKRQPGPEAAAQEVAPFSLEAFAAEQSEHRPAAREVPRLLGRAFVVSYRAAPRQLQLILAFTVVGSVITGLQLLLAKDALTSLIGIKRGDTVHISVLMPFVYIAVVTAVSAVLSIISAQAQRMLGEQVQRDILRRIMDVCVSVDLEAFESPGFFNRLQRVLINSLHQPVTVANGLIGMSRGIVGVIGLTAVMLAVAPLLVPVLALVSIPLIATNRRGSRSELRFAAATAPISRKRYYLQDVVLGRPAAKEVRAFTLGTELIARWEACWDEYMTALRAQLRLRTTLALIGRVIASTLGIAAIALLLYLIAVGDISLAAAGTAGLSMMMLSGRVEGLSHGSSGLYESALFLNDLERFLSLSDLPLYGSRTGHTAEPFRELSTDKLSFTYPTGTEPSLRDIDFTIRAGEVIAIVGENGSGKTTLAKILADLYQPTSGRVLWDGQDLTEFSSESIRRSVAIIFQDFLTYALPAAENIGVGRPEAIEDLDGIIAAAKQSGAHEFLRRLPEGYKSHLSTMFAGGRDISLGQWQRVALARAFFRDAPFVILDEPSSALDARAEHDLFARVRTLLEGRTVLMISHRFSSVRSADRIYVMKQGEIVEHGSHEALMEQDGLYAELFRMQADAYLTPSGS